MSPPRDADRRRLWIFTELYHPELTSSGRFLTGIAEGLASSRDVRVVCSQPTYGARGLRAPRRELLNGVEVWRCRSTTLSKDVLGLRVLNGVTLCLAMFARAWRHVGPGDAVLVVTTPPLLPLCIAPIVAARGGHLVVLVHDVYPDVLCVAGLARPHSLVTKAMAAAYRRVFRTAERVVALGRDMKKLLEPRVGSTPVVIIPNWGELDEITPQPRAQNRLLARLGLTGRFVVHHLGNMGRTHDLDVLLEAAKLTRGGEVHFLFSGEGRRREELMETARRLDLGNVTVQGGCPPEELSDYLNACDLGVVSLKRGMAGVSVPSRFYNILAAGKPVLAVCEDHSEMALVIREHGCGWVVEPDNPRGVVEVLDAARANPSELSRMGQRARAAAEASLGRSGVVDRYRGLLDDLDREPSRPGDGSP